MTRLCNISFSFQKGINGQERIRTFEGVSQWIYSPPRLTASVPTRSFIDKQRDITMSLRSSLVDKKMHVM